MSTLIVIVLLGLVFAFLAVQNTAVSTVNILGYAWTLPIYMIVFGALLIGFFISWIVSSISRLGTWSNLHGKDSKIREGQHNVAQLQNKIKELELENAKLQGRNENKPHKFLDRFRRNQA